MHTQHTVTIQTRYNNSELILTVARRLFADHTGMYSKVHEDWAVKNNNATGKILPNGGEMHEAGIAKNILDISIDTAKQNSGIKITLVKVRVGKMSAIDEASLRFAFDALKEDTIAAESVFEYEAVPLCGRCVDCGATSELEGFFVSCPACGSQSVTIISGNELEIAHIEID